MYSGSESDGEQGNVPLAMFGVRNGVSDNLQVSQPQRNIWKLDGSCTHFPRML